MNMLEEQQSIYCFPETVLSTFYAWPHLSFHPPNGVGSIITIILAEEKSKIQRFNNLSKGIQ